MTRPTKHLVVIFTVVLAFLVGTLFSEQTRRVSSSVDSDGHWDHSGSSVFTNSGITSVGIGTNTPVAALHVREGTDTNFHFRTLSGATGMVARNDANTADVPIEIQGSQIRFLGGNVGLGTTNPQAPLHVEGNVKINGNITSDGQICIGSGC